MEHEFDVWLSYRNQVLPSYRVEQPMDRQRDRERYLLLPRPGRGRKLDEQLVFGFSGDYGRGTHG
jgi:hypothetical protein